MKRYGDRAIGFDIAGGPRRRRALLDALRALPGVLDAIVAEHEACLVLARGEDERRVLDAAMALEVDETAAATREHAIATIYDGADLEDVARATGLSARGVEAAHAGARYVVSLVGFMPGFAYLRGLPDRLVLPRRASPRPRVPARSVAIAASYSGVYPSDSPGGWHLLGRAPAFVPFSLALGDEVRFVPTSDVEAQAPRAEPRAAPAGAFVEVASVRGFAHVVGAPAHGRMHEGVPPGGPMSEAALARAGGAPAIEVFGSVTLAFAGGTLTVASTRGARVAYVGVEGGFAPLGPIRRGDRLALARDATPFAVDVPERAEPIAVALGPDDLGDEAREALLGATFTIASSSNRVGTRLEGPPVPAIDLRADRPSTPMVKGAIERTPAGLVVLGPDHPTTGGYPVVGVLREHAMDAFFTRPLGAAVRFVAE